MQGSDLILFLMLFQRGLANASDNQDAEHDSCISGDCSVKDGGPCLDDGETKLYRWDPVKVCQYY